jgi:regulator of protease activity HflC (stomatin/prohibitin superfamily)
MGQNIAIVIGAVVFGLLLLMWFLRTFIKITQEYERGVVFFLGRVNQRPRGPGLIILIPGFERMVRVDLRVITLAIPPQDCITADNVTVSVDAVAYFRVTEPVKAIVNVRDFMQATTQIAQTSLRSVIGQVELDTLLTHRDEVNHRLGEIIDKQTHQWGVDVGVVEVKDVQLPEQMQRAMAKQAEAEREKRAKIIHAQGELAAAEQLHAAAALIAREPAALQLRYLQTLSEISVEKNSTIVLYDTSNLHLALHQLVGQMNGGAQNGTPQTFDMSRLPQPPQRPHGGD